MEIEVHELGGVLGLDRRYRYKEGTLEVIDGGRSRGTRQLEPERAARIAELAAAAAGAPVTAAGALASDEMETTVDIRAEDTTGTVRLRSGDTAPTEVWDLIDELSRD